MIGIPPHTAASNFSSTPFAPASAKSSLPCAESSALFAVITCFFRDQRLADQREGRVRPAGQLHDDRHGRVIQDLAPSAHHAWCPVPRARFREASRTPTQGTSIATPSRRANSAALRVSRL